MLARTHLSITLFFVLIMLSIVEYKLVFVLTAFISTFIPDVDSKFSTLGKRKSFRILQFFVQHRGIFHSFIFLILVTLFFVLFFPVLALGFFLGYSLHLLADSFTLQGVRFFYPFGKKSSGLIKTGGRIETLIFVFFSVINLAIIFQRISLLF